MSRRPTSSSQSSWSHHYVATVHSRVIASENVLIDSFEPNFVQRPHYICQMLTKAHQSTIGVNLVEKMGGPYHSFHSLSSPSFSPSLPWSGCPGVLPRQICWVLLCCRWVLQHFQATKGWLLVKGFFLRIFWKCVWRVYFLHLSSLSPFPRPWFPLSFVVLPSLVSVSLLQSELRDIVNITEQMNYTLNWIEEARIQAYDSFGTHCLY